jgi:hypothetical protein
LSLVCCVVSIFDFCLSPLFSFHTFPFRAFLRGREGVEGQCFPFVCCVVVVVFLWCGFMLCSVDLCRFRMCCFVACWYAVWCIVLCCFCLSFCVCECVFLLKCLVC